MRINWKGSIYPLVSAGVIGIDQWIKQSVRTLPLQEAFYTIPGILELTHQTNTGAAFSLLGGHTALIAVFSAILLLALMYLLNKTIHLTKGSKITLSILIGAGIGNWVDRVFFGGVTDYIRLLFVNFAVFNFADICITCSVLILSVYIISGRLDRDPEVRTHGTND